MAELEKIEESIKYQITRNFYAPQIPFDQAGYEKALHTLAELKWPGFICISPPRSMTTWLFEALSKVKGLYLPEVKETNILWNRWRGGIEDWRSCREASAQGLLVGDITPSNSNLPRSAIQQLSKTHPNLKILLILRNPVDRTLSHLAYDLTHPSLRNIPGELVSKIDPAIMLIHVIAWQLSNSPLRLIDRWLEFFPAENFHISFADELAGENAIEELLEITKFLIHSTPNLVPPGIVHKWDRSKIEIPQTVHQLVNNYFSAEMENLGERLLKSWGKQIPAAWPKPKKWEQLEIITAPAIPGFGGVIQIQGNIFKVVSKEGALLVETTDPWLALAHIFSDKPKNYSTEVNLQIVYKLDNSVEVPNSLGFIRQTKGFKIFRLNGYYFGVAFDFGEKDIAFVELMAKFPGAYDIGNFLIKHHDLEVVESKVKEFESRSNSYMEYDLRLVISTPQYNIVQAGNRYIAIANILGPVNLRQEKLGERDLGDLIFSGEDMDQLKNRVTQIEMRQPVVQLVGETELYNIASAGTAFIAIAKRLGHTALFVEKLGERSLGNLIIRGETLEEVRAKADEAEKKG